MQARRQWLIGLAGGLAGAFAMNVFARAVVPARHGREANGAAPGSSRAGRGMQPPQAQHAAEDDAAVRVGTAGYRAITGEKPSRAARLWLGTAAHYAFGGFVGACYAALAGRLPLVRAWRGTVYGTAVWAVADEMIMPLLGLSRGPQRLPAGVHAYALAGHWVYGVTLDSTLRAGSRAEQRTSERPFAS